MKNKKLYYTLAGMLIITIFAVSSTFYLTFFKNSLMTEAEMHLNEITIQTAGRIEEKLSSKMELIDTLAADGERFDKNNEKENMSRLKNWVNKTAFTQVSFVDESGKGYTSDGKRINFSNAEFWEAANLSNGHMSPVIRNYGENFDNVIIFKSSIYENSKLKGALYGIFEMENISRVLELNFFDGSCHGFVIDDWGNVLAHSDNKMINNNIFLEISRNNDSVDTQKIKSKILSHEPGNALYTHKGIKYFVSYAPVVGEHYKSSDKADSGISVLMVVPYNHVFEHSNIIMKKTAAIVSIAFILFCIIMIYLLHQQRVNEESLEKAAYEDELCKVRNRKGFGKAVNEIIAHSNTDLAAIYTDIDNFKIINSIFGYDFGDMVLKAMAVELKIAFGKNAVVGRINADNFQLLVPYTNKNSVFRGIEKTAEAMKNRFSNYKEILLSSGIYFIEDLSEESEQIFDKAQLANKNVKFVSRMSYAIYEESFTDKIENENWLIEEMKKAIETRQFEVYYQPKFEIATEKTIGAEALIRWNHIDKGFISPAEFIPLAEKTQLIVEIGRIVFEQVCKDINKLRQHGISNLPIAVNLSRVELYQPDIVDIIQQFVESYQIDKDQIQIEITETVAVNEYEELKDVLLKINNLGISMSIDDFGSGYSSLSCLHKFNVDTLKLDRSFLVNLESNEKGINILRGMIELSRELGLKTVCEGIETREQLEILKKLRCKYGQGFIFARPMPLKELEIFLNREDVL